MLWHQISYFYIFVYIHVVSYEIPISVHILLLWKSLLFYLTDNIITIKNMTLCTKAVNFLCVNSSEHYVLFQFNTTYKEHFFYLILWFAYAYSLRSIPGLFFREKGLVFYNLCKFKVKFKLWHKQIYNALKLITQIDKLQQIYQVIY